MLRIAAHGRRGSVFVVTMWVVVALTGMVLVLAYAMRVEATAGANRLAQVQAEAAERGAEQLLLSVADAEVATPGSTATIGMEQRQIGGCYVWVLHPDPENEQGYAYGLTDEAGKIDLNTATSSMLAMLPGITQDEVDAIVDWRDTDSATTGQGAEDDYYLSLPEPYHCKNGPFETVEELMLVKGITRELLFGNDTNRNGVIDVKELQAGGVAASFNAGSSTARGFFPFVTVYGLKATGGTTTSSTGSAASTTARTADVNAANQASLRSVLQNVISGTRLNTILTLTQQQRPFRNVFDYYFRVQLTIDEFTKLYPLLTANATSPTTGPSTRPATTTARVAKVNINTAPRAVLLCLPGLEDADATAIIGRRQNNALTDPTNIAWLAEVLPRTKVLAIGGLVTGKSTCFSGDIVAVSGDGRAFKRYRVVIDARQSPSKLIYRRDLTGSGWPLPAEIRAELKNGQGLAGGLTGAGQMPGKGFSGS